MDKKLDKMKLDIQKRIKQNTGLLICSTIFLIVATSRTIPVQVKNENAFLYVSGFQLGLLSVLVIYFLNNVVKYNKALKEEKLLKQLYYKEHDERMNYINQKVGELQGIIQILLKWYYTRRTSGGTMED